MPGRGWAVWPAWFHASSDRGATFGGLSIVEAAIFRVLVKGGYFLPVNLARIASTSIAGGRTRAGSCQGDARVSAAVLPPCPVRVAGLNASSSSGIANFVPAGGIETGAGGSHMLVSRVSGTLPPRPFTVLVPDRSDLLEQADAGPGTKGPVLDARHVQRACD